MRLACPACAAVYEVPDALLGAGRRIRCARCGHAWHAAAPAASGAAAPAPVPAALPAAAPMAAGPVPPPPTSAEEAAAPSPMAVPSAPPRPATARSLPPGLALAWAGSLAVVAGFLVALWLGQQRWVEAWPPLARLYGWLGA